MKNARYAFDVDRDEKRREVAQALRNNLKYMLRKEGWYGKDLNSNACGNAAYRNIAASVEDCGNLIDGNYIHIVELLADLIDRPTCHLVGTTSDDGLYGQTIFRHELSCGHTCETGWEEPPAYCNECGCRVVEKEEDDAQ